MAAAVSNKKRGGASNSKENWSSLNESGASGLAGPNHRNEPKPICECMCYQPNNDQTRPSGFFYFQPLAKAIYEGDKCQLLVAIVISINFLCNVIEKEVDPQGVLQPHVWRNFEITFNVIFLLELVVNMYARWWKAFWFDGWNIFDVVVVAVGCVSFGVELEGPFKLLRCLRAFRVFRLFKRVKSLNRIIVMVSAAIPGVTNAFLVIVIMISIYSLVAVEFFSTFGTIKDSEYTGTTSIGGVTRTGGVWDPTLSVLDTSYGDQTVVYANLGSGQPSSTYISNMTIRTPTPTCAYLNSVGGMVPSTTTRNICVGNEYWGTFTRAWFTLFQVLTGESWSEAIARPVLFGWDDYGAASIYLSSIFFISFVVINAFILFNVFIAVLLDKVISPDEDEEVVDIPPLEPAKSMRDLVSPAPMPGSPSPVPGSPDAPKAASASPGPGGGLAEGSMVSSQAATVQVDMQVARTTFNKFDLDGSGTINTSELGGALKSMGINIKDYEAVVEKFDTDKSGTLEFEEFADLLTQIRKASSQPKKPNQMMMRLMEVQQGLIADQRLVMAESHALAADVSALKDLCKDMKERLNKSLGVSDAYGNNPLAA